MTMEHGDDRDLGRGLELLWGERTRPARGRPPGLSLDRIVAAAVEVADGLALAEGIEALSMRRVATRLGVGTMSLYRYVPGKSELLDLMLDRVIEALESELDQDAERETEAGHGWRELLATDARGHWRLCMEHPWCPFVDQGRPLLGPNSLRGLDRLLGLLRRFGADDRTLMMLLGVQYEFVNAVARSHINELRAVARTGVSSEEFWEQQAPTLEAALNSGAFPTMAGIDEKTFDYSYEQLFEFGLARLHDGFAPILDTPPRPSS